MQIKVSYSLAHEVGNYLNSVWRFRRLKHGNRNLRTSLLSELPTEFQVKLKKCRQESQAKSAIKEYLLQKFAENNKAYAEIAQRLETGWEREEQGIIRRLSGIYGQPFPFKRVDIFLTTIPINPYHFPDWMMVYAYTSIDRQLRVISHELNHFVFYHYYNSLKDKLGRRRFESLKEALTVLMEPERPGYPAQARIRRWLLTQEGTVPEILSRRGWKTLL